MITFEVFWYVANVQRCDQEPTCGRRWESSPATLSLLLLQCVSAMIHPALHHHLFSVKENVATYSCLITFGSLAGWRRKFGAWLEPSMRDSRCSIVSKSTPSCSLHLSAMDSDVVFYNSLTDMPHGVQAWERLLIDIWKVANNGLLWWVKKADNVVNIQQLPMWWENLRGHWSAISDRPHHLPESLIIEQPLIWSSIFRKSPWSWTRCPKFCLWHFSWSSKKFSSSIHNVLEVG